MKLSEQAAFANPGSDQGPGSRGLTKREYFAAQIMQSIASVVFSGYNEAYKRQLMDWQLKYGEDCVVSEAMAKDSIRLADELLNQLES